MFQQVSILSILTSCCAAERLHSFTVSYMSRTQLSPMSLVPELKMDNCHGAGENDVSCSLSHELKNITLTSRLLLYSLFVGL
jgi:hypothetical protein